MTYGYEQALARRAASMPTPGFQGGSGYFAARAPGLDPALFDGDHLYDDVRHLVLGTFYRWAERAGWPSPQSWSRVWIAGSGITTAWNADREAGGAPGDLDTLIGIDYDELARFVPSVHGASPEDIGSYLNSQMHSQLWPSTAHQLIHGSVYELTYYVNAGVGDGPDDLLAINPYAAYDVTDGRWTLHPVQVPEGFSDAYFSDADRAVVELDRAKAQKALSTYQQALMTFNSSHDQAHKVNALRGLHDAVRQGAAGFDAIHDNRHAAFAAGGKGYFDPANYRWQAGKGNGTVNVLRSLKQLDEQAHKDVGTPCEDIGHLLLLGALANGQR